MPVMSFIGKGEFVPYPAVHGTPSYYCLRLQKVMSAEGVDYGDDTFFLATHLASSQPITPGLLFPLPRLKYTDPITQQVMIYPGDAISDFKIDFHYLNPKQFTFGNICIPRITAKVIPQNTTYKDDWCETCLRWELIRNPETGEYERVYDEFEAIHNEYYPDPSDEPPFDFDVFNVGDLFILADDFIYDELAGGRRQYIGEIPGYWVLKQKTVVDDGTIYEFEPCLNLDVDISTDLRNASFSTVDELLSITLKLLAKYSLGSYFQEDGDMEVQIITNSNCGNIPINSLFIKRGITIRDVLSMIGEMNSFNILSLAVHTIHFNSSGESTPNRFVVNMGVSKVDSYTMVTDKVFPSGVEYSLDTIMSWGTDTDFTVSKAAYTVPYVNGVMLGDVLSRRTEGQSWRDYTPSYYADISNSLTDSAELNGTIVTKALDNYMPDTPHNVYEANGGIGHWVSTTDIRSPETIYYTPMTVHMSTLDYMLGRKDWGLPGRTPSGTPVDVLWYFLNPISSRFFNTLHEVSMSHVSTASPYCIATCFNNCFRIRTLTEIDGPWMGPNNELYGFISELNIDFYNGVTITCSSDETRSPKIDDWEGRPFITDITTIIDGEEVSLYPDHVYGWKIRGVNCPTEDYSIGNISSYYEMTFDCDIRLPVGQMGYVIGDDSFIFEVVGVERKIRTKNMYTETCIITVNEVDEVIPDSSLTPIPNETLDALAYRLLGAHLPSIAINKNYVVNEDWAYSGITKRQLAQWIYQLAGISYCGYGQDSDIVGNERSYFAPSVCPTYVRHAFHFSENDTKSIDKADYQTQLIDKIWFTNDNTNSGFSYGTGTQQLTVPYNPLIDTTDTSFIQPLFNKVNSLVEYTPMKIETFLGKITLSELIRIYAGNDAGTEGREFMTWMMYYDPEEDEAYYCPVFNWEASDSGIILQGTGSKDRRVSNTYLDYDTQQTGRYAKISSAASSAASEAGQVSGDVTALSNRVSECEDDIAQNALDIQSKVSLTDYNGTTIINKINANGVTNRISSTRVDLSGYVQDSELSNYVQTSELSNYVQNSDYTGDEIISRINATGVTSTIDLSRISPIINVFNNDDTYETVTPDTYEYSNLSFQIPADKVFTVEVQGYTADTETPTGVVLSDSDSNISILKEVVSTNMPSADRLSMTYVGNPSADTTYYIWTKAASAATVGISYTGWYM